MFRDFVMPKNYLGEVGGLAGLVLGNLVHGVLVAPLVLAVGPPLLGNVHHLRTPDTKKKEEMGQVGRPSEMFGNRRRHP